MKLIGCILLIIGTCIGAGILGLPIATAQLGFVGSAILLIVCWFVMMMSAFLLLEASLWLPQNSNLISLAKATLGPFGQLIAWLAYIALLYSLLCAYIAGGSGLFHTLLAGVGVDLPDNIAAICFTIVFGAVVFCGIRSVDYVNRVLVAIKFVAYVFLIIFLAPFVKGSTLMQGTLGQITSGTALTVTVTSFGYATIIPSLRIYFANDIKQLKIAIILGSTIPLICYLIWDAAIMGVLPMDSFAQIMHASNTTGSLTRALSTVANESRISVFAHLFTSICVLTSFLGVALCITDFLADGLQIEKKGIGNFVVHSLTLWPPLIVVLFFPKIFIQALAYAGMYSIILLIVLPVLIVWFGRYRRKIAGGFTVPGGKPLLIFLIVFSCYVIMRGLMVI